MRGSIQRLGGRRRCFLGQHQLLKVVLCLFQPPHPSLTRPTRVIETQCFLWKMEVCVLDWIPAPLCFDTWSTVIRIQELEMNGVFSCCTQQWCRMSAGLLSRCIPPPFKMRKKSFPCAAESVVLLFMPDVKHRITEWLQHSKQHRFCTSVQSQAYNS